MCAWVRVCGCRTVLREGSPQVPTHQVDAVFRHPAPCWFEEGHPFEPLAMGYKCGPPPYARVPSMDRLKAFPPHPSYHFQGPQRSRHSGEGSRDEPPQGPGDERGACGIKKGVPATTRAGPCKTQRTGLPNTIPPLPANADCLNLKGRPSPRL